MRFTLIILPLLTLAACGQPDTPEAKIAHERHENFELIGDAFKDINDGLKDQAPDVATLRVAAATIAGLAPKVEGWFPKGTGPQDGVRSDTLQTVWTEPAAFKQAADRLVTASAEFDTLAKAGDVPGMRTAAKTLGGTCKGCHDKFREE